MKNVVVLGKGALAIKACDWFKASSNHKLLAVVADTPEPTWTESVSEWAIQNEVALITTGNYKDLSEALNIDLAVSVFYGKIIKEDFINRCGDIINLHNSPLPKYRGVRPINWALRNNEKTHGVTIHRVTKGIDDGPILGQVIYPIYPDIEEVEDVYNKALDYGWLLFQDVMSKYDYAAKHAKPQEGSYPYYSMNTSKYLGERQGFRRQ
tara:strand:- start:2120 stop:2746 length:627 start_codon:yes stop_codon:yes gene_type:complete